MEQVARVTWIKQHKKARLAIRELKLLDACLICILILICFLVFFLQFTQPEARAKKTQQRLVWLFALLEREKKSALVGHLNHTFNLTGRHKKSAPYYTDTQTRMHIWTLTLTDTHTHAQGVRTKTTLKSYSATRCFSQIPDYNTNGAARACVCARASRFVVLTTATCTFSQRASYFTHKKMAIL